MHRAERARSTLSPAILLRYHGHRLRREISNFSLLRHRDYKGFLVSMHQSGTHWLKHMLGVALARRHGLPEPRYSHANEMIGGVYETRDARLPRLASTHSIPYAGLSLALRLGLPHPRYVVLVRDLRAALVANYEKWKGRYGCDFGEFLRGDPAGRRFNSDLWWCLRFCNAWGDALAAAPQSLLLVRYEDLRAEPLAQLRRVRDFWDLDLDDALLVAGRERSGKEQMAGKEDPAADAGLPAVRSDRRHFSAWYGPAERALLDAACDALLRHRFGYDLADWQSASSAYNASV